MNTKLDVTVSVDPDSWTVALKPLGDLTARNAVALLPLALKAAEVFPGFSVAVDFSQTRTASPAALPVLAAAGLRTHSSAGGLGSLRASAPDAVLGKAA